MAKTGVLLINLGTPKSPSTGDVRRYLREFLDDERVIDVPYILRKILVHGIIAPFRAPKSAKLYKEVWTD
ncbi:MAG: ferrochelatase, partial [Bacteroidia bacterium]|nr:ferrochelatase [Bacteroidia bacterium]